MSVFQKTRALRDAFLREDIFSALCLPAETNDQIPISSTPLPVKKSLAASIKTIFGPLAWQE